MRLFSSLPEQVVVVRASGRPPRCRLLRDPPSFIEKAERKIHVMSCLQTECVAITGADRVREGSATCDAEEKVNLGDRSPGSEQKRANTGKTLQTITNQHLQELRGPDRHASKEESVEFSLLKQRGIVQRFGKYYFKASKQLSSH